MTGLLFLLLSIWIGFIVESKLDLTDKNFWAKLSFAIIIGTLLSTWLVFLLSLLIGFSRFSLYLSLFIMFVFFVFSGLKAGNTFLWFRRDVFRNRLIPLTHLLLLLFIMPFFIFGVWETKKGDIAYLGNYTDLSYHLSIVSAFTEQTKFLPENPQSAGAKMSYHFLVNFHSAILHLGGFNLLLSVIIPQVMFAFALATMVYYFYKLILRNEISVFFASSLLIMGHIAFSNLIFPLFGYIPRNMKLDLTTWHMTRDLLLYPFFWYVWPYIAAIINPNRHWILGLICAHYIMSEWPKGAGRGKTAWQKFKEAWRACCLHPDRG